MITFPNAKINIGLNIISRRPDGYHDIESIMIPTAWRDILEVVPSSSSSSSLHLSGRRVDCPPEKNLVMKALFELSRKADIPPVDIYLRKIIPDGAGLGGGSADAAFLLKTVNSLYALGFSDDELAETAAAIGADCPFFIYNRPMSATGIGTRLSHVSIPQINGLHLLIVKPPIHISTREAYAEVSPRQPAMSLTDAIKEPVSQWRDIIQNDFEISLRHRFPQIARIKETLYHSGALYASLSGSGSAVYALFDDDKMAEQAALQFNSFDSFICRLTGF